MSAKSGGKAKPISRGDLEMIEENGGGIVLF